MIIPKLYNMNKLLYGETMLKSVNEVSIHSNNENIM